MGGFLKTLAKVGLVELDDDEMEQAAQTPESAPAAAGDVDMDDIEKLLQEDEDLLGASSPSDTVPDTSADLAPAESVTIPDSTAGAPSSGEGLVEGRSFEEIYKKINIPESAFPAEKMLRVLDGLKAMDPATRKAAVTAMDLADDAWSVDDSVLDAQRKIKALQAETQQMAGEVSQAAAKANADIEAQETYQEQATASIRKQIADLESLLQEELQKVAQEKATIESNLKATRESFERETARFGKEIERLQEIQRIFSNPEGS